MKLRIADFGLRISDYLISDFGLRIADWEKCIPALQYTIHNPKSEIRNPQFEVRNPQFAIHNPQSTIRNRESAIRNPKSEIRNRGFSLLEVVVALAIVSIGITVALQLFSGALKNVRKMDLAGQAMNYAENVMNEILSDETIKGPITRHDDLDDNFRWEAMVQDFEIPEQARWDGRTQFPMKLLSVRVDVIYKNDKNGKLYRLVCLKPVGLREQPASNTPGAFSAPPNAPRPPVAQPNNPFRNFQ